MEATYKCATIGILLITFFGLMSIAGCGFHVAEFIGSVMIAIVAARLFHIGTCKIHSDHLVK